MSLSIKVHGADYSVYVRIVRLLLEERGAAYELVPLDIFAEGGPPADYLKLQPFGKIPAVEIGDIRLFETDAIVSYLDDTLPGEPLTPSDPLARARMRQLMRIGDNYVYPLLVWGLWVPEQDGRPIEDDVLRKAAQCCDVLESMLGKPFALGGTLSLADLYLVPMLTYCSLTKRGLALLAEHPKLGSWFSGMRERASVQATSFPAEAA